MPIRKIFMNSALLETLRKSIENVTNLLNSPDVKKDLKDDLKSQLETLIKLRESEIEKLMPATETLLEMAKIGGEEGDEQYIIAKAPQFSRMIEDSKKFSFTQFERFIKESHPEFWKIVPGRTADGKRKTLLNIFSARPALKSSCLKISYLRLIFYIAFKKDIEADALVSDGSLESIIQEYIQRHGPLPKLTEADFIPG